MSAHGDAAVHAAGACQTQRVVDPVSAWEAAVQIHLATESGRKKGCPKSTFLGLCEEGLVCGVPQGKYTRSRLNKDYALRAVRLLQSGDCRDLNPRDLWQKVMSGEGKKPNSQMDVVLALWQGKLLVSRN